MDWLELPGITRHVVQQVRAGFSGDGDRHHYLRELFLAAEREFCSLHAYVLLERRVHLLLTPMASGQAARMMQALRRRHRAGGGGWHSLLLPDGEAVLRRQRWIELSPVRAGLVAHPARYRWSSHGAHAVPVRDCPLQPHRAWLALGPDLAARQRAWAGLVATGVPRVRGRGDGRNASGPWCRQAGGVSFAGPWRPGQRHVRR